ncbi:unnamed protein product [Symbiodinium sp. CCMP2592]|nr:unnamed protein product [Symbiodinium sp. CCMP2592]
MEISVFLQRLPSQALPSGTVASTSSQPRKARLCHRKALPSPGFAVAVCGLTVQRAQRSKHPRWGAAVAEEVLSTPPAQAEGEAVVIWLHGLGDTGQGWSTTAPALQQMGLPMLRFVFPTAPLRGIGSKGLRHSWYDVPTLDPDEISRQSSPPGLLESAGDVLGLVEPHAPSAALRSPNGS